MKYKLYLLLVFYFIIAIPASAQDDNSIFWKISGKGLTQPSYLYGTVHLIGQSDFFLPDSLEEIFKSCGLIVLEIDMDDPSFTTKAMQLMFMKDNTLKQLISERDYKKLETYFYDSLQMPLAQLGTIKPIFLTQFLMPKIINQPMASYELKFVEMTKNFNKEVTGLETIDEQMAVLDSIPYKQQAEMIVETIDKMNESRELYSKMIKTYRSEDLQSLNEIILELSPEIKDYDEILLIKRNKNWIPLIKKMISEKSSFIACGVMHLFSDIGVVELLRAEGYEVTPVEREVLK